MRIQSFGDAVNIRNAIQQWLPGLHLNILPLGMGDFGIEAIKRGQTYLLRDRDEHALNRLRAWANKYRTA